MTGPITFVPIPFPKLDDECDGVGAFRGVSDVAGEDFRLIDTRLSGARQRWVPFISATQATQATFTGNTWSEWVALDPAVFPGMTFTLPNPVKALLVMSFANVCASVQTTAPNPVMSFTVDVSGSGIAAPLSKEWLSVTTRLFAATHAGSRAYMFTGTELIPGGQVVIKPWVNYGNATQALLSGAYVHALAFTGESL